MQKEQLNELSEIKEMKTVIYEGIKQAIGQLLGNKLRSFLSLLGITIGIFCIISVKSAVDSLEENIRESFRKLGTDVLYLSKMPWGEDPFQNYWKYMRRPNPSYKDYEVINKHVSSAQLVSFSVFAGQKTARFKSNSVENSFIVGCTLEYPEIFNLQLSDGRFFTPNEYQNGAFCCVLGSTIAENLFPGIDPIGKTINLSGYKAYVIGIIKKSGNDIINPLKFDQAMIIPFTMMKKIFNTKPEGPFSNTSVSIKAKKGVNLEILKDDVIAAIRANHRLHPKESNDFSLNEVSLLDSFIKAFFGVLNVAGLVIGGFSILVGMFSVANIMFVSVKERTNIIGIKKALGARQNVILLEFLVESVILCLLGGILGLLIVLLTVMVLSKILDFDIFLSLNNILTGIGLSALIGILAGFIPAMQAAKMDPVEAIRK